MSEKKKPICSKCKIPALKGANFCAFCGKRLNRSELCHHCGAELDPRGNFCDHCGRRWKPESKTNSS